MVEAVTVGSSLGFVEERILETLARISFGTQNNLVGLTGFSHQKISAKVNTLVVKGWLSVLELTPRVYKLTHKAAQYYRYRFVPWRSMSVIQRLCMANQAEVALSRSHQQVSRWSREQLKPMGLYPGTSEFVFQVKKTLENAHQQVLVVIDDNARPVSQLKKLWERTHLSSLGGHRTYQEVIDQWRVYVSCERELEYKYAYAEKQALPIAFGIMKTPWNLGL